MIRRVTGWILLGLAVAGAGPGCISWLEVDDGEEAEEELLNLPVGAPWRAPDDPAELEGSGPVVPETPGLRVPLAGYWTRARLDALDLVFPYTWGSLMAAEEGPSAASARPSFALLRLEGLARGEPLLGEATAGLRAVIPLTLPAGIGADALRAGTVLPADALAQATVTLRTSPEDLWTVTLERLHLTDVNPDVIVGDFEGVATRGAKGQRERRVIVAFVALRAPDGRAAMGKPPGDESELPEGMDPPGSPGP